MKKSNKLIIIFIAVLYVVPLSAMIFDLKNYKTGDYPSMDNMGVKFSDELEGFETRKLENSVRTIKVEGNDDTYISVIYRKDETSGIKYESRMKDFIQISEDASGNLTVDFKDKSGSNRYVSLYVYGPTLSGVNVKKSSGLTLSGTYDSLAVNVADISNLSLNNSSSFNVLKINADNAKYLDVSGEVKSADITLNNGKLIWSAPAANNLVMAVQNTEIDFTHNKPEPKIFGSIRLNTVGKNDLNFEKIVFNTVSGSVSDSTTIQMPVLYLKQLIK